MQLPDWLLRVDMPLLLIGLTKISLTKSGFLTARLKLNHLSGCRLRKHVNLFSFLKL
jgi:hypothetical protein